MEETNKKKTAFLDYEADGRPIIRWLRVLMFAAFICLLQLTTGWLMMTVMGQRWTTGVLAIPIFTCWLAGVFITHDREMMEYRGEKPRFRFSLGLVFLLISALCLWLAVMRVETERARKLYDQRTAFTERLSQVVGGPGKARYSGNTNELMIVVKNVEFDDDDFRELVETLEDSPDEAYIYYLDLNGCKITDASVEQMTEWNGLQYLFLGDTAVTETGARRVGAMQGLKSLGLGTSEKFRELKEEIRATRKQQKLPPI